MKLSKFGILLFILLSSAISLTGCSTTDNLNTQILSPDSIQLGNQILKYNTENIADVFWDAEVDFVISKDNKVRSIQITDRDIETYKGISVGDSIDKVKLAFKYEIEYNDCYTVLLNGTTEINLEQDDGKFDDTWIYLTYYSTNETPWQDGVIEKITIYDCKYGQYLR